MVTNLLEPGQVFAQRYRVDRFLARGGHGLVYVAEQRATETSVALKVLWPHLLESEEALERFQLEAKVAGRIRSENVVRVLDAGRDEETRLPYLVMELLEGESLHDLVARMGPLGLKETSDYMLQIAAGLDRAHRHVGKDGKPRPIVHRDLKPENLFLARRDSGAPLVKILDFGIAKIASETAGLSGGVIGTPLFISYEQLASQPVTAATDVWALGLIAFYLLTGHFYWRSAQGENVTLSALFSEVLQGQLDSPSERLRAFGGRPAWPPAFDRWFSRCVNRDMAARYQSAGEASAALAEALLGLEWAATQPLPASPSQPKSTPAGSNPSTSAPSDPRLSLSRTHSTRAGRRSWPVVAATSAIVLAGGWALLGRSASETPTAGAAGTSATSANATQPTAAWPSAMQSATLALEPAISPGDVPAQPSAFVAPSASVFAPAASPTSSGARSRPARSAHPAANTAPSQPKEKLYDLR